MPKNELKDKILNEIATGATAQECSDKYGIPAGTIRSWLFRLKNGGVATKSATQRKPVTQRKNVATVKEKEPVIKLEDVDEELTEKQRLFCFYYIRNFNATQAAIRAGYSPNCPSETGYELLRLPHIKTEINRLKKIRAESMQLTPDDIIERYMRIAFADMTDFVTFGQKDVPLQGDDGVIIDADGKVVTYKDNYIDFNDHTQVDGGLICEISKGKQGMKIKLEDRQKALDWLANFFEMNPMDKHKKRLDREKLKLEREKLELQREAVEKENGKTPEQGVMIVDDIK
jgi:phage terminase small subunit